jgi:serine/threonine protein kinase/tetratricopeptide (TPR) repeat protein
MSSDSTDRNLLIGLLALQNNLITREQLVSAFSLWALDKSRVLADLLQEQQALKPDARSLLEALVQMHVAQHDGDPQQSLRALSSLGDARQELLSVASPELQASLTLIRPEVRSPDLYATQAGVMTSQGTRFRILRPHARGGLGEVHVALDTELQREVALKEIQDRHADQHDVRNRFKLEAEITGGLEHPGIVPVYGLGTYDDGRPYYAMRFIKGDNLQQAISKYHDPQNQTSAGDRNLALRGLLRRLIDVCDAMQYAHDRGILHRDLKPGNIMIGKYGETLVVDWGLAKVLGVSGRKGSTQDHELTDSVLTPASSLSGSVDQTLAGSAIGTPAYMSPEQAAGRLDELGPASDVYSLGATLYHILTGIAPCAGKDLGEILRKVQTGDYKRPRQVLPTIPVPLDAICRHSMALQPDARYASPRDLADDLEYWLADESVVALPEGWTAKAARWLRRNRAIAMTLSVAMPVVVASLLIANYIVGRAQHVAVEALNRETKALALSAYTTTFESGLQRDMWDQNHLDQLDATLTELDKLSPERAVEGRERLVTRYAVLLRQQLRAPRLTADDLAQIKAGLALLESRNKAAAQLLRTDLELRLDSWEIVVELQKEMSGWQNVFNPQSVQLRDGALVTTKPTQNIAPSEQKTIDLASQRALTNQKTSIDCQCEATFTPAEPLSEPIGIEFVNAENLGYAFLAVPIVNIAKSATGPAPEPAAEQALPTPAARVRVAILRNGQVLRETMLSREQIGSGSIRVRAQRRGSRLELQINQLPVLEMIDPFPLPLSQTQSGTIALQLPTKVSVSYFASERMRSPSIPSPLESADELYGRGQFQAALAKYREQAQQSGADEFGEESRYKQAECLLQLSQHEEAQQLLQQLSQAGASRWTTLANFALWSMYLEKNNPQGAEDIFQKLTLKYKFEDLARIAPEDLRQRIVRLEHGSATVTNLNANLVYHPQRTKNLQRAVDVQRLLNDNGFAVAESMRSLIDNYRINDDYARAVPLAKELAAANHSSGDVVYYCDMLREAGQVDESLAIAERELTAPNADWGFQLSRIYCLLALNRPNDAEAIAATVVAKYREPFDAAVKSGAPLDHGEWDRVQPFKRAQFIRGFLLESQGNPEAARTAWREAALTGVSNKMLHQTNVKTYYMLRSLTNDADEADIELFLSAAQGGREGNLAKIVITYFPRDSFSKAFKNTWTSSRGKELARRFAFEQMTPREQLSIWPVAMASQYMTETLLDTTPRAEQEELIWTTSRQAYDLLALEGKLAVSQILPLAVTWKGNPGFLGWDSVANSLPVDFRGKMAYFFGLRYQKLGRPADAQKFFQTAIKISAADSLVAKCATLELAKLKAE